MPDINISPSELRINQTNVYSGGANRVIYQDSNSRVQEDSNFTYENNNLNVPSVTGSIVPSGVNPSGVPYVNSTGELRGYSGLKYDNTRNIIITKEISTRTHINVLKYGADNTGVTSSVMAISGAIQDAVASNTALGTCAEIYIPQGTYLIDQDSIFTSFQTIGALKTGLKVVGDGIHTTKLYIKDPGTGMRWLYKNPVNGMMQQPSFRDITFEGESIDRCSGFKIYSEGHEKDFGFNRCEFKNLHTCVMSSGTANGDHMTFRDCSFAPIGNAVLHLANPQSVSHQFLACTSVCYKDFIYVNKGGGGCVSVVGGSLDLLSSPSGYVLHTANGPGVVGAGNDGFWFYGFRVEFSANKGIVKLGQSSEVQSVYFDGCNFFSNGDGGYGVRMFDGCMVTFRNCSMGNFRYLLRNNIYVGYSYCGNDILFDNCQLYGDGSLLIDFEGQVYGTVKAINCRPYTSSYDYVYPYHKNAAMDFNYNWRSAGRLNSVITKGTGLLKREMFQWPKSDLGYRLYLPRTIRDGGCHLQSVHLYKPAQGVETDDCTFYVANSGMTEIYAQTTTDQFKNEISLHADIDIDLRDEDRTLAFYGSCAGSEVHISGYAYVEYY